MPYEEDEPVGDCAGERRPQQPSGHSDSRPKGSDVVMNGWVPTALTQAARRAGWYVSGLKHQGTGLGRGGRGRAPTSGSDDGETDRGCFC